jgi:hypothetical protein
MVSVSTTTFPSNLTGIRLLRASASKARAGAWLKLEPFDGGWALRRPDGELVSAVAGPSGRQACLELAHAQGVLTLLS